MKNNNSQEYMLPQFKNTLIEHVGNTPLVKLNSITQDLPQGIEIWVKMECMNPGGSVKDRAARQMIADGLKSGALNKDKVIIDSTSGNTGIALAYMGSILGLKVELVLPENVSNERKAKINSNNAKLIYSDRLEGSDGAIILAQEIYEANKEKYFKPDQYNNPSNPKAHYLTTGPEIWQQTQGKISHFVAAIGTSGTVMGNARFFKEQNPNIEVYAAEPDDAFHGLEGLKHMESSLVPGIYDATKLSGVISVPTEPSYEMARTLAREEGIFPGQSAGGGVWASLHLAQRLAKEGCKEAVIVTVICDGGDKYYSKGLWDFKKT